MNLKTLNKQTYLKQWQNKENKNFPKKIKLLKLTKKNLRSKKNKFKLLQLTL